MDPYDRAIYRFRPNVTGKPSYSWYPKQSVPKKTKVPDFQHQLSTFSKTGLYPSDFIVSPEWISEEFNETQPFLGRRWKPWPYEYHGARYWPHGTVENKLDEERNIKALVTAREIPSEFRPVEGVERETLSPSYRLGLTANKDPWRPKTSWGGYVVSKDNGRVFGNSQQQRPGSSGAGGYSRHVKDLQYYKGVEGYDEYYDHNSPYHSHHPDDVALSTPANACNPSVTYANNAAGDNSKGTMLFPDLPYAQRPRFQRPFVNMANAMWIGSKYTTSPGQN